MTIKCRWPREELEAGAPQVRESRPAAPTWVVPVLAFRQRYEQIGKAASPPYVLDQSFKPIAPGAPAGQAGDPDDVAGIVGEGY